MQPWPGSDFNEIHTQTVVFSQVAALTPSKENARASCHQNVSKNKPGSRAEADKTSIPAGSDSCQCHFQCRAIFKEKKSDRSRPGMTLRKERKDNGILNLLYYCI